MNNYDLPRENSSFGPIICTCSWFILCISYFHVTMKMDYTTKYEIRQIQIQFQTQQKYQVSKSIGLTSNSQWDFI